MKNIILLLSVLIQSVTFAQLDSNQVQVCKYPFFESADSLMTFVAYDVYKDNKGRAYKHLKSDIRLKYYYDSSIPLNYDSVFHACFDHLRNTIGEKLFCENTRLFIGSFYIHENRRKFHLTIAFNYPKLLKESPQNIGGELVFNERINIKYHINLDKNGKTKIIYPTNVIKCSDEGDCKIYVTRKKAIEILNEWNLIKEDDKVQLTIDGMYWKVHLYKDTWTGRHLKINLTTGRLTDLYQSYRID